MSDDNKEIKTDLIEEAVIISQEGDNLLIPTVAFGTGSPLHVNGTNYIMVSEDSLNELVLKAEEMKKERDLMEYGIYQICGVLGLTNAERTEIKPEVVSGDEGVFKNLMKAGTDLFLLFSKSSLPVVGKKAEAEIKQKFEFIEKLLPLLKKR
jgi:hypothetical protein